MENSKKLRILTFVLTVLLILQLGCPSAPQPKECIEFFSQESTNRLRGFVDYDLQKQLAIHRCSLDRRPRSDRSYEVADRGKVIIPTLLEQLNRTDYKNSYDAEKTKFGIILIFQRLASRGELDNNKTVIEVIDGAVSEIKTDWIKEEAEESLVEIKKNTDLPKNR